MSQQTVILTGGAGFIGSHIAVAMMKVGYDVIIIDDFSNSSPIVVDRIARLSNRRPQVIEADLSTSDGLEKIRSVAAPKNLIGAIHLAGLKAVGESVAKPELYYRVNIGATLNLLSLMEEWHCSRLVFSSSATVYGAHNTSPVTEEGQTGPQNPYGFTKFYIEQILTDFVKARPGWQVANLRYFNPVGAHESGQIGEDPQGIPNNLFPYIAQVAVGRREALQVFGADYPTKDGTGVRDYIHVCDLAEGHLSALSYLMRNEAVATEIFNLGTGIGYSVLDIVVAFEAASGKKIPFNMAARRDGDIAEIYADASKAERLLGWRATKNIQDMCADHWHWQAGNPLGYQ